MRCLLVVALLLLAAPAWATDYVRYINPAADVNGNGTTSATSSGDGSHAFKTQNLAEGAAGGANQPPLNLSGHTVIFECATSGANPADDSAVLYSGWSNKSYANFTVRAASGQQAGTAWDAARYRLSKSGDGNLFEDASGGMLLDGLQAEFTGGTTTGNIVGNPGVTRNCFLRDLMTTSTISRSAFGCSTGTQYVYNSILSNKSSRNNTTNGIAYCNTGTLNIYSCTVFGGGVGIVSTNSTVNAKNVYSGGGTRSDYYQGIGGTLTQTNCAASDTTAAGTNPQDNVAFATGSGAYFSNVGDGTENLAVTSDSSTLVNNGTTTSGEGAPLNFTTDIRGYTRVVTWDIGAYDRGGTAPPAGPLPPWGPMLLHQEVIQ